ncbi:hypothetical protein NI385_27640 (plasmid) [Vibrio parahaemolyticus]|uniref:hypothetical protein n=1 Tax=Vibrio TaxID=662 RepID=UPI0006A5886A|nr:MULTISPECIES: hypothetical protein [Vibrio]MCS0331024.1 hypothetical protein [Vibrio diabolicus]ARN69118.1 hypothetical protein FORC36_4601 [Vibrio vulnificus]EGQ8892064.1 hypothetical protein [Vibrio parahaemolyticus]EGR3310099.1 hypothetical protein [Vibrio parahaemolyticus]KOF25538.1 hypothetical protein ACX13_22350 [Vibrio parahaemolyticus]
MAKKQKIKKKFGNPQKQAQYANQQAHKEQIESDKLLVCSIMDRWAEQCKPRKDLDLGEHYLTFTLVPACIRSNTELVGTYEAVINYCEQVVSGKIIESNQIINEATKMIKPLYRLKAEQDKKSVAEGAA